MTALDVYRPPFKSEDGFTLRTANDVLALMSVYDGPNAEALVFRLVSILNGESKSAPNCTLTYDAPNIYINDRPFVVVRGWSHLTGSDSLGLDSETAGRLQDEFAEHVISKLTA